MEGLQEDRADCAGESSELDRIIALVMKAIEGDVRRIAESIVLKRDDELLGPGEFELRDNVLRAACHILQAAVNDRKKGGTKGAARPAQSAAKTRASSSGEARRW